MSVTMGRYLLLVPMALALAACGGGGGGALSLDPVASAATKTEKSGGEHMTFRVRVRLPGNGGSFVVSGSGDFDSTKNRGRASLQFAGLPQLPGKGEEIVDGTVVYFRFPALENKLPGGKRWLKIDLEKQGRAMGVDLNSLMQNSTGDPTQMLHYLESASTGVQKIGTETVAGAATTHYSSVVDLDKLAQARPREKTSIRHLEQLTGVHDIPVDVWIDGDGYVRKLKESIATAPPEMKMVMSFQLSSFGKQVTVTPPPADQVLDVSSVGGTAS
jgi:hypothetical protein